MVSCTISAFTLALVVISQIKSAKWQFIFILHIFSANVVVRLVQYIVCSVSFKYAVLCQDCIWEGEFQISFVAPFVLLSSQGQDLDSHASLSMQVSYRSVRLILGMVETL